MMMTAGLLPFVIFLVSYLPFFLSATDLKLKFIKEVLADENAAVDQPLGLLSESICHFLRLAQAVLYLAAQ